MHKGRTTSPLHSNTLSATRPQHHGGNQRLTFDANQMHFLFSDLFCCRRGGWHILPTAILHTLSKGVIMPVEHEDFDFISTILVVPQKDNKVGLILNLRKLSSFVAYHHFKMETIQHILSVLVGWLLSI